jgi:hypothetical protein
MVFTRHLLAVAAGLYISTLSAIAGDPPIKTFENPVYKNYALDWCYTWAADCGKPVADAYCKISKYDSAKSFKKLPHVGEPTRLIGSNQVCDEGGCDSFASITCQKQVAYDDEDEDTKIIHYEEPMAGKRRLDWCLTWATDCGQAAADYYCDSQGHTKAVKFKQAIGLGKTRLLKTSQKCTGPQCTGFEYIDCE